MMTHEIENTETDETLETLEAEENSSSKNNEEIEAEGKSLEDFIEPNEMSQLDFSDVEDDVNCTVELEVRKRVVEAVLFVSDKPVGMTTLLAAFGTEEVVKKPHIREALDKLEDELIEQDRGFRLHQVDGGYQLRTAEDLKDYLQNTIKARSFRLTGPSLEALAMVAYKQPCPKNQIDEIRGVDSSHLIRALMDRNLLAFAGKSELPGKPMLYKTTPKFLEVFGLRNIKELPSLSEIEALLPNGIGEEEEEEKETLSDLAGKLGEDFEGSYSASEEELGKINDQLSTISTETEFFEQEKQREKERKEKEKAEDIREALMVGEEVSTRDQNWLVRYDEKMAALETPENAESEVAATDLSDEALEEAEVLASVEVVDSEDEATEGLNLSEEESLSAENAADQIINAQSETAEPFEDFLEGSLDKDSEASEEAETQA